MRNQLLLALTLLFLFACNKNLQPVIAQKPATIKKSSNFSERLSKMKTSKGYLDFYWDEDKGKILLAIDKFDTELLYVNSLAAGVGSNDIGLDRGQLGRERERSVTIRQNGNP